MIVKMAPTNSGTFLAEFNKGFNFIVLPCIRITGALRCIRPRVLFLNYFQPPYKINYIQILIFEAQK